MSDSEELLDIEQAARLLNVSETSLRRWTNSGRLACLRVGRRRERRFRKADLLAFVENHPAALPGVRSESHPNGPGQAMIDGIPVMRGAHLCGLYGSDEGRTRQAAAFLGDGLRAGMVNFLSALPEARKEILDFLALSHPSVWLDVEAGRLVLSEYADTPEAQWIYWESQMTAAANNGATLFRMVGDVWGLARRISPEDLLRYETEYEVRIARRFPVVSLCQYDARRFSSLAVLDALKAHRDTFQYPAERILA